MKSTAKEKLISMIKSKFSHIDESKKYETNLFEIMSNPNKMGTEHKALFVRKKV